MSDFVLSFLIYGLVFIGYSFLLPVLSSRSTRHKLALFHSVLLTLFTFFGANTYPLFVSEQLKGMAVLSSIRKFFNLDSLSIYQAKDNFILIDITHDLQLLPERMDEAEAKTTIPVTDRRQLTQLLSWIQQDSLLRQIDLIVCDIGFDQPSTPALDSALLTQMLSLTRTGKLLVGQSEQSFHPIRYGDEPFRQSPLPYASVDIPFYDNVFVSYPLFTGQSPNLPYQMYLSLTNRQATVFWGNLIHEFSATEPSSGAWMPNAFIPQLMLTQTDLYGFYEPDDPLGIQTGSSEPEGLLKTTVPMPRSIGHTLTNGQTSFTNALHRGRTNRQRNIIFIGLFADDERDMHQTAFGPNHGSVLLINAYLNMAVGRHRTSLLYVIYLFGCFYGLSLFIFNQAKPVNHPVQINHPSARGNVPTWFQGPTWELVRRTIRVVWRTFIIDQTPFWLLLLMLIGANLLFNQFVNVMGLAVYFLAINLTITIFRKRA